jgi:hypothetical protein
MVYVSREPGELFTEEFVQVMKTNMWTYMNPEIIHTMFPMIKTTYMCGLLNDCYTPAHKNTVCFKIITDEDREAEPNYNCKRPITNCEIIDGHYTYVDNQKVAHSTYEEGLIYKKDDGVCHGAAMIYALNANKYKLHDYAQPTLISNPKSPKQFRANYRAIMQHYIWLIETGLWNAALRMHFPTIRWRKDGTCLLTDKALACLKAFVEELDALR